MLIVGSGQLNELVMLPWSWLLCPLKQRESRQNWVPGSDSGSLLLALAGGSGAPELLFCFLTTALLASPLFYFLLCFGPREPSAALWSSCH